MKLIRVPDRFKEEVRSSSPEELLELRDDIIAMRHKGLKDPELITTVAECGWTPEFADWFLGNTDLHGIEFVAKVDEASDQSVRGRRLLLGMGGGIACFLGLGGTKYLAPFIGYATVSVLSLALSIGGLCLIWFGIKSVFGSV